ncbi:MAG: FAD-dependent oxidoreductase [Planctomycetota bacterium]|nr:MAG: FAD-dependent oxidoreductase [Planctomycetota bacterium]
MLLQSWFLLLSLGAADWPAQDFLPSEKEPPLVVFVTGDEEYRSEESMPLLARMLQQDHGLDVAVCHSLDEHGYIDPNRQDHISGLHRLAEADLMVLFTRFRQLPDDQLRLILDFAESGKPMVGFRTATHPFRYPDHHPRAEEMNRQWPARIFGQGWITHHGHFDDGEQPLTEVQVISERSNHPILRGIQAFPAYSWLYHVEGGGDTLQGNCEPLLTGTALRSSHQDAKRLDRFPLQNPVAWTKHYTGKSQKTARVFFSTLGHPYDFQNPQMRRLAIQGILWALNREERIPAQGVSVALPGPYRPNPSGFGQTFKAKQKPAYFAASRDLFFEAEAFDDIGGWVIDTATTLQVGSPYLMAHGLGRLVKDAKTSFSLSDGGEYRVWVRTKDWVAPWGAPGQPGRFQVVLDGQALETTFGTASADWHWQDGGRILLSPGEHTLGLRDLTGFNGRCDAILITRELHASPPEGADLAKARHLWMQTRARPKLHGGYDLVVVGGGYSGMAAAISAARQSLKVALIQDRFVLGGNGSSEIRVWANGGTMRGKFPHVGEIVEEFADHAPDSPGDGVHFGDLHKEKVCRREPTLDLYLGHFVNDVELAEEGLRIEAVIALDVRTGQRRRFEAEFFADCTGHGTVGALAGADFEIKPSGRMGMSNMWFWQVRQDPPPWPETPWALPLEENDFPATVASRSRIQGKPFWKGEWFWESGFDLDPIEDLELIRDWNLRAVFGAFSALKGSGNHPGATLEWVAHVGGTRESRLLTGDVVLTREDIVNRREFADGCVATTWDIDLHYPKERYAKKFPNNPFISRAEFGAGVDRDLGYLVPYRCFYSRNVENLFMAGRCISVTHEALGTVRVMRTCGMMGEVVGKAAYVGVKEKTSPRGVYEHHLTQLLKLLQQPGAMRRSQLDGPLFRDPGIGVVQSYRTKAEDRVDGIPSPKEGLAVSSLPGIVIDDEHAVLTGSWRPGSLIPFVGRGYRYANPGSPASARFPIAVKEAGVYEVRLAWVGHENRGRRVLCVLERTGFPPLRLRLDQSQVGDAGELFHSLGRFPFPVGEASLILSADDADGCVHADAVQVVPAS